MARKKKLTVEQAAATGDHYQLLVAMRDRLAHEVSNPDCPPKDLAPLMNRLSAIGSELAKMGMEDGEDDKDVDDRYDPDAI